VQVAPQLAECFVRCVIGLDNELCHLFRVLGDLRRRAQTNSADQRIQTQQGRRVFGLMLQGVDKEFGRLVNKLAVEFFPLRLLVGALLRSGLYIAHRARAGRVIRPGHRDPAGHPARLRGRPCRGHPPNPGGL
jgi:hypothetical protein